MKPHLKFILKTLCMFVEKKVPSDFFQKKDWFLEYQWTVEEENAFKIWLKKYLKVSRAARIELMGMTGVSDKYLESAIELFLLNYGWKTK